MCRLLARLDNGNMQRRWTMTESKNPWLLCVLGVSFFPIYVIRGLGLNIEPCKNRHTENLWVYMDMPWIYHGFLSNMRCSYMVTHLYILSHPDRHDCSLWYWNLAKGKVSAQDSKTDDLPQAGKRTTKTTATWLVFLPLAGHAKRILLASTSWDRKDQ